MGISFGAYPHIGDAIFAHTDPNDRRTQLALRRTCRYMQLLVDLADLEHVLVDANLDGHHQLSVLRPDGSRIPCMRTWNCMREWNFRTLRRDKPPVSGLTLDSVVPQHILSLESKLKQAIRILDVRESAIAVASKYLESLPATRVRQLCREGLVLREFRPRAESVVLFWTWSWGYGALGEHHSPRIPTNARRVVLSLPSYPDLAQTAEITHVWSEPSFEEMVVIFSMPPGSTVHNYHNLSFSHHEVDWGFIQPIIRTLGGHFRHAKWTFVDVLPIRPSMVDKDGAHARYTPAELESQWRRLLVEAIADWVDDQNYGHGGDVLEMESDWVEQAVRDNVRIISRDQYAAEVGAAQFRLETVCDLVGTPAVPHSLPLPQECDTRQRRRDRVFLRARQFCRGLRT